MRRHARTTLTPLDWTPGFSGLVASFEYRVIVGFEAGEGCIKHVSPGDDHNVQRHRQLASSEEFSRQALRAIPLDC